MIDSDKAKKTFELLLLREELFQRRAAADPGAARCEAQRAAGTALRLRLPPGRRLAHGREGRDGPSGAGGAEGAARAYGAGNPGAVGEADRYALAEHLKPGPDAGELGHSSSDQVREGSTGLVTDQPGRPYAGLVTPLLTNLTDDQRQLVALCEVPRKQAFLMQETGLSHRTFFRRKRLDPLVQAGLIRATHPHEPNHPDQGYVATDAGLKLLHAWRSDADRKGAS